MNRIGDFIKSFDKFGPTIGLNFRGSAQFKSVRGGLISLLQLAIILWLFHWPFIQFVTQSDPSISSYSLIDYPDQEYFLPQSKQFIMATIDFGRVNPLELDPRAGKFEVFHQDVDIINSKTELTPIEVQQCDIDALFSGFEISEKQLKFFKSLEKSLACLEDLQNYGIAGHYEDFQSKTIGLRISYCKNDELPLG